jgi:hypothetical protein
MPKQMKRILITGVTSFAIQILGSFSAFVFLCLAILGAAKPNSDEGMVVGALVTAVIAFIASTATLATVVWLLVGMLTGRFPKTLAEARANVGPTGLEPMTSTV